MGIGVRGVGSGSGDAERGEEAVRPSSRDQGFAGSVVRLDWLLDHGFLSSGLAWACARRRRYRRRRCRR